MPKSIHLAFLSPKSQTSRLRKLALISEKKLQIKRLTGVGTETETFNLDFSNAVDELIYRYPNSSLLQGFSTHYALHDGEFITSFGLNLPPPAPGVREYNLENVDGITFPEFLFVADGETSTIETASVTEHVVIPVETAEQFMRWAQPRLTQCARQYLKDIPYSAPPVVARNSDYHNNYNTAGTIGSVVSGKLNLSVNVFRMATSYIYRQAVRRVNGDASGNDLSPKEEFDFLRSSLCEIEKLIFGDLLEKVDITEHVHSPPDYNFIADLFFHVDVSAWEYTDSDVAGTWHKYGNGQITLPNRDYEPGLLLYDLLAQHKSYDDSDAFESFDSRALAADVFDLEFTQYTDILFQENVALHSETTRLVDTITIT